MKDGLTTAATCLQTVIWAVQAALTAIELLLARYLPGALWLVLALDLFLVSPLLLGRQAWYLSVSRSNMATREFYRPTRRDLLKAVFCCARATYVSQWWRAIAWRWGWWWRCVAVSAVSVLPALSALSLSFLTGDNLLGVGLRLSLQIGAGVALFVGGVVMLWWLVGYYPAVYLIAEGMPVSQAFASSRRMMRGYEGRWITAVLRRLWCVGLSWLPVVGWYAMPRIYNALAALAAKRLHHVKKS